MHNPQWKWKVWGDGPEGALTELVTWKDSVGENKRKSHEMQICNSKQKISRGDRGRYAHMFVMNTAAFLFKRLINKCHFPLYTEFIFVFD